MHRPLKLTRWLAVLMVTTMLLAGMIPALVVGLMVGQAVNERANRATREASSQLCQLVNQLNAQLSRQNVGFILHNNLTANAFQDNLALRHTADDYRAIESTYRVLDPIRCDVLISQPSTFKIPLPRGLTHDELNAAAKRFDVNIGAHRHGKGR